MRGKRMDNYRMLYTADKRRKNETAYIVECIAS